MINPNKKTMSHPSDIAVVQALNSFLKVTVGLEATYYRDHRLPTNVYPNPDLGKEGMIVQLPYADIHCYIEDIDVGEVAIAMYESIKAYWGRQDVI